MEVVVAAREPRMTPLFFHLMLSLSKGPGHGYAMMGEVAERTGGRIQVGPSSLYYALGRLEEAGWIAEADPPGTEEAPHEERRRYYRLTALGRSRLEDEAATLADIVAHARAQGVLP
jgi:DNA-binding PadR family transcriptional regulator